MTALPEPVDARQLRVSNADRERVAAVLSDAAGDGRLDLTELDERLAAVYAAKTFAELAPLTRDLVADERATSVVRRQEAAPAVPPRRRAIAILSGAERRGRWWVPARFSAVAILGGVVLDLREALFTDDASRLHVVAALGGVEIIVPDDATVHVEGIGILGGFDESDATAGRPGGPTIVVSGVALLGGVSVRRETKAIGKD